MDATLRSARALPRSLAYAAAVFPLGLASLATAFGSADGTVRRWEGLAARTVGDGGAGDRRPRAAGTFGHAVLSVLLGAAAWVLLLLTLLVAVRGVLYGVVDPGPYDTAWGGPSLAGAWVAHLAIAVPTVAVTMLLTSGVTRLHRHLTRRLQGAAAPWWVVPVALVLCAVTALFVVGWAGQL